MQVKGTHGDFIFADMAVPIIEGQGKNEIDFRLTKKHRKELWNFIGMASLSQTEQIQENGARLELVFQDQSFIIEPSRYRELFVQKFEFNYLKKEKPINGAFLGIRVIDLVKEFAIPEIAQVKVYSFDNIQLVYSNSDLLENLVVGANFEKDRPENMFTLFLLKDQFPNRVLKQLKKIEFYTN